MGRELSGSAAGARSDPAATSSVRATGSDALPLADVDLVSWFASHGRDLPWRRQRDPWAILVAEAMLQQTQVARVLDRWPRFLERFPTVVACAAAPVADLVSEWAGLGYNRRAVSLHRAATAMVEDHGGIVPTKLDDLLALPGVGPYTARAVRVFAFETDDAVVDTNVARILARAGGASLGRAEVQRLADEGVPAGAGWAWNQAMLDVGAIHCRARQPACTGCPVASCCRWLAAGRPEPDPACGSSGVSGRQSRFEGSDRQGRGRLVAALRNGPVPRSALATVMGWPDDEARANRVSAALVADGLADEVGGFYRLPVR